MKRRSVQPWIILICGWCTFLLDPLSVSAAIYKCVGQSGRVTISDTPCPQDSSTGFHDASVTPSQSPLLHPVTPETTPSIETPREPKAPSAKCIKIQSWDSKPLDILGRISVEVAWKAVLQNVCSTEVPVIVTFKWLDREDFAVHQDDERLRLPASQETTVRGKTFITSAKLRDLARHGVEVKIFK